MGRHADPGRGAFYRSLLAAASKGLLALLVVGGITLAAVAATESSRAHLVELLTTGGLSATAEPEAESASAPTAQPSPSPAPSPPSTPRQQVITEPDTGTAHLEATPEAGEPTADAEPGDEPKPPAETAVQVLDGGAGDARTHAVVRLLEDLGYEIVAVNPARCCYEHTTVFYTEGNAGLAEALQARDGRFVVIEANPNLSEAVDLHVVVGTDWPGG